jgi:hypothetical protein
MGHFVTDSGDHHPAADFSQELAACAEGIHIVLLL